MTNDRPSALNTRDDLREVAERYETVAALDLTPGAEEAIRHTAPGSRVPPGAQEILDADEIRRALTEVDEWAEFLAHVLADECELTVPDETPARLRLAGEHAGHFIDHADESATVDVDLASMPDRLAALDFMADLKRHLSSMKRMSGRGVRRVRTGMRCQRPGCSGQLVSPLGGDDRKDDALVCDRCSARVEYVVWSHWPRARVQWITVDHAAKMLATSVAAVYIRASRGKWRKVGTGRDVRYSVDDVREAAGLCDTPDVRIDIEQVARVR